jgi:Domain of Unknown Function (DUF1259)
MMLQKSMISCTALVLAGMLSCSAFAAEDDWQAKVGQALGKLGEEMPGGVYRVALPRTDLTVTLDGIELKPGFALGSWLAFEKVGDQGIVMGDLVLTMNQVTPVMRKLIDGGIEVTALHNHLIRTQPVTMYMHVLGRGDPVKMAAVFHDILVENRMPFAALTIGTAAAPPPLDLDTAAIDAAIGAKGTNNGGVYSFGIPRAELIKEGGMIVPPAMGSANAISFQPTGSGKAAVTGDFALTTKEVQPVMKALCEHGIEVTALHNHMLDDEPRLFFMHFWANGEAKKLTEGLKAALEQINISRS